MIGYTESLNIRAKKTVKMHYNFTAYLSDLHDSSRVIFVKTFNYDQQLDVVHMALQETQFLQVLA
jgi:hypothetical protein